MIEYDFEGYAKSKIDKGLGYLEGFSKGYHQAKSEWVGLTKEEVKNEIEFFFRHSYVEDPDRLFLFAQIIQDKLKEKNT